MLRDSVYRELHGVSANGLTRTQRVVFAAIIAAVTLAFIGTEPTIPKPVNDAIEIAEFCFGALFLFEYVARMSVGCPVRLSEAIPWHKFGTIGDRKRQFCATADNNGPMIKF